MLARRFGERLLPVLPSILLPLAWLVTWLVLPPPSAFSAANPLHYEIIDLTSTLCLAIVLVMGIYYSSSHHRDSFPLALTVALCGLVSWCVGFANLYSGLGLKLEVLLLSYFSGVMSGSSEDQPRSSSSLAYLLVICGVNAFGGSSPVLVTAAVGIGLWLAYTPSSASTTITALIMLSVIASAALVDFFFSSSSSSSQLMLSSMAAWWLGWATQTSSTGLVSLASWRVAFGLGLLVLASVGRPVLECAVLFAVQAAALGVSRWRAVTDGAASQQHQQQHHLQALLPFVLPVVRSAVMPLPGVPRWGATAASCMGQFVLMGNIVLMACALLHVLQLRQHHQRRASHEKDDEHSVAAAATSEEEDHDDDLVLLALCANLAPRVLLHVKASTLAAWSGGLSTLVLWLIVIAVAQVALVAGLVIANQAASRRHRLLCSVAWLACMLVGIVFTRSTPLPALALPSAVDDYCQRQAARPGLHWRPHRSSSRRAVDEVSALYTPEPPLCRTRLEVDDAVLRKWKRLRVAVMGDSIGRFLFYGLANELVSSEYGFPQAKYHANIYAGSNLAFYWNPYSATLVNTTQTQGGGEGAAETTPIDYDVLIVSIGLWDKLHVRDVAAYERNIADFVASSSSSSSSSTLWDEKKKKKKRVVLWVEMSPCLDSKLMGDKLLYLNESTAGEWRQAAQRAIKSTHQHHSYFATLPLYASRISTDGVHYDMVTYHALARQILRATRV